jgi:hypothetical protein
MSEHDAHAALTATARMRMLAEPVEDAQLMTFSERQYRAREARGLMVAGLVADSVEAQINTIARSIVNVETTAGAELRRSARTAFDKLVRMPPALHLDQTVNRDTSSYAPYRR